MTGKKQLQILHISDLHIDTANNFDRSLVLDPLIERVKEDGKKGDLVPELVIVTGDIAFKGVAEEYALAKKFFDDLLGAMELQSASLFIVPGNHDVNRKKYRPKDIPKYDTMKELNDELEDKEYRADLFKGMTDYFDFVSSNYPHLKPLQNNLIPFAASYTARCGKKIGLAGLNSAWMCRKSPDKDAITIGEYQIIQAMNALKEQGLYDLVFAIFHHPLNWLWSDDRKRCRRHFNDKVVLCGHLHEPEGGCQHDYEGSLFHFQVGAAYLCNEYDWPERFQYITFDWNKNQVSLDFRKYVKDRGIWRLDADIGDDGKKKFSLLNIQTDETEKKNKIIQLKTKQDQTFEKYCRYALNEHRYLPSKGFETTLRIPVEIERVYVNMKAHVHAFDFDGTVESKNRIKEKITEEQLSALNIKSAFKAAERYKIKDMVILGDPGSGKTTLLKYILVMLIGQKAEDRLGLSSDIIPFLAPLRDLKDPDKESLFDFISRICLFEEYQISENDFKAFLDNQRGIVLLDGLDEVADEEARIKTCQWIDRVRREFVYTQFIITSRFGGYLGKSRLEGAVLELLIQDFDTEEVRTFLKRWFEAVEAGLHPEDENLWREKGREEGLKLAETIKGSEHLKKLAVNPLLLQIIALVHKDRGTLPQRRVELFDECTNVLLEKWDLAKGLDVLLNAREARQVLQPVGPLAS